MRGCPGRCIYCDQDKLSGSVDFNLADSASKVREFIRRNPGRDKQVAFYGGSFTALEKEFREELLSTIGEACDDLTSFRISTHPLYVDDEILDWCEKWKIRTIELGIQDFCDTVLNTSCRGYSGQEALESARRVKEHGFELGIQLMPGLPGWSETSLRENRRLLEELRPSLLRLYPLIVIRGTKLEQLFQSGEYLPLNLQEAVEQCADYFPASERAGTRIIKLGIPSNIDPEDIVAGPWHPAFGELVKAETVARRVLSANPQEQGVTVTRDEMRLLKAHGGSALSKVQAWFEMNS